MSPPARRGRLEDTPGPVMMATPTRSPTARRPQRILVVDDDAMVRETIRLLLEHRGYEVVEAGDGRAALERDGARPFDLVIADVVLPGTGGVAFIRALLQRRPDARIVAISGGGGIAERSPLELAAAAGATLTLPKPFTGDQLADTVRAGLGGRT